MKAADVTCCEEAGDLKKMNSVTVHWIPVNRNAVMTEGLLKKRMPLRKEGRKPEGPDC